jgi:chemotaxis protein CheC
VEYTTLQMDAMKELANVGGGHAATALSQMVYKPIGMDIPTIEILDYNEVFHSMMPEDTFVVAVTMRMMGDGSGNFLFVCTEENAEKLVDMMLPNGLEGDEKVAYSAIVELVNILVNSYLNAISKLLDVSLISSVPVLVADMFGAILSSAYMETEQYDENIMIIRNEFLYKSTRVDSSLYFIPRPGVLDGLFSLIGV